MFFEVKLDLWFLNKIDLWFIKNLNSWFLKRINIVSSFDNKKNLDIFENIFQIIKLFYLKWWFILSIVILILAILDNIIFHKFHLSLISSFTFFFIWVISLYKNILNWELFLWNRLVWTKDVVFILSLIIVIVTFILLNSFNFYEKTFYSLLAWFIFYITIILSFDYTNTEFKLFKSVSLLVYIVLTLFSFLIFIYNKIPSIKSYFTVEKIIYKEKPIYKKKIVYKEKIVYREKKIPQKKETVYSRTYIAPNDKMYEIFITNTWAYFTWYNNQRKYFNSYSEAISIIDKFNPKKEQQAKTKANTNTQKHNNPISKEPTITGVISSLLNNNENKIVKNTNTTVSYYSLIPEIIQKYWLDSSNKKDIFFKYISKDDTDYNYFKTAYYYKMFGKNSNPNLKVRCRNFAILLWLAEWWNLKYTRNNVFDVFYNEAIKKWYKFNNCCKSQYDYLTDKKKICILK